MKYKVGDKVRIKSLDWYKVQCMDDNYVVIDFMNQEWCGYEMTIIEADENFYHMKEDSGSNYWTDEMIECKVEDEMLLDKAGQITDFEYEGLVYTLPNGYQFIDENGNVINATKIVLEKKKKEYPKTYEECCKVLDWNHRDYDRVGYKAELLCKLQVLLLCRDAYWKIAGKEMGLGKPWKPNWEENSEKSIITKFRNVVAKFNTKEQYTFAFPTEEMRDEFYENFKELINECKELL